jgi:molybdopterin synthase sulfur carrier subunit
MTTPEVLVRLFAAAADAAGATEFRVQAASLTELRVVLTVDRPGLQAVLDRCSFLVDGTVVRSGDRDLSGVATVDVLPPFAGG